MRGRSRFLLFSRSVRMSRTLPVSTVLALGLGNEVLDEGEAVRRAGDEFEVCAGTGGAESDFIELLANGFW
jgi:hypothetical protein